MTIAHMTEPSNNRFSSLLASRPWLLADGATGSNLFDVGLMSGDAPELWNIDHPDRIKALHQGFVEAGADIILTNSFGGTTYRLKLHNAQARVAEINLAAARLARQVADASGRVVAVAGSIGFIGLVVPHLVRPLVGNRPGAALVPAGLAGAALLLAADMAVRLPVNGQELKLGVLTALLGAPFFLWLVVRSR